MEKRPNIVMLVADQMRADTLHHLGNPASQTPNLDRLAREGVSFADAYCQNPVCVPSRCSFMTGWYPHTKGHRTMHFLLERDDSNLLKEMTDDGYHVYWVGRNHFIPEDQTERKAECCEELFKGVTDTDETIHGYCGKSIEDIRGDEDYYSLMKGRMDPEKAKNTLDPVLMEHVLGLIRGGKLKEPFCIYIAIIFPHPPYECEEPWYSLIDRSKVLPARPKVDTLKDKPSMLHGIYEKANIKSYSEEKFREIRAVYLGMTARVDDQMGRLMSALKEEGYYDDTNIVFFADHGDYTGDYGITEKTQNTFENPLTNVPLIIKPARGIEVKPRVTHALTELIDIGATLSDLCGFPIRYHQFGKSLRKVLAGEEEHRDAVFCEGGRVHGETQAMESVRSEESIYWPRISTQCEEGPQHTKAVMVRMGQYKYVFRLYETDEFYDLENDPLECDNAVWRPEYQGQIMKMKERMLRFFVETRDFVPNRKDKNR